MRLLALGLVAVLVGPAAAESGKVSVQLVGEATVRSWMRGSDSWQDLTGQLEVDNGLEVPIEGIHLELDYFRQLFAMPGEKPPAPMKAGQDDVTLWLDKPVPAGTKLTVPLPTTKIYHAPTAGFSKGLELHPRAVFTGRHTARAVAGPVAASPGGIRVTVAAPTDLDTWVELSNVEPGSTGDINYGARAYGPIKARIENGGQTPLRSLSVVVVMDDKDISLQSYPTNWGNGFLAPGKSDATELSLTTLRPVTGVAGAFGAEVPIALAVRNEVFAVEPAPVLVQKATPLKAAASRGATVAKLRRGDAVVELADGDPWVEVRTAAGAHGFVAVKALQVPLKVHGKRVKGAFARVTADGLYVELCSEARSALVVTSWDGFTIGVGATKLHLEYRGGDGTLTTAEGAKTVPLVPVPYGKAGSCELVHEHTLRDYLGISL